MRAERLLFALLVLLAPGCGGRVLDSGGVLQVEVVMKSKNLGSTPVLSWLSVVRGNRAEP